MPCAILAPSKQKRSRTGNSKVKKEPRRRAVLRVCVKRDLVRWRFTERRSDGSADASGSQRRKRSEPVQPRPAEPAQQQPARPGQRRQDHSDGTVRIRCDESPAHSHPRRQRHRWRPVTTRLQPRRPIWFSGISETSWASFCWTNVGSSTLGNHTDVAVNPAQLRVHEPDNSMAPKWRTPLPRTAPCGGTGETHCFSADTMDSQHFAVDRKM